ncbi:hypothetical protein FOL47_010421 [Perkinsus chesapeaki]|uniref:C3H1-type domain-containing protein n=1 Tax=Perkinsus chesapeaki TaxID=330153 RepID=A0A7J6L3X1_PERCH|nr:hypothetical protein FOL47_010421 [Perkinsus chesapeaki]
MDSTEHRRFDDEEELLRYFSLNPTGRAPSSNTEDSGTSKSQQASSKQAGSLKGGEESCLKTIPCPKAANPEHQDMLESIWPLVMEGVDEKMQHMERALIKRHNIKMMNEMQEVVRQISAAKTRNEEVLLAYNACLGELARALTDLSEKQESSKDNEELKRHINQLRQHLNMRCGQTTEQVAQLKQSVIITLQRERADMQQRVSQLIRNDLAIVIQQCDRRLKEEHSQVLALKKVLKQLCSSISGAEGLTNELPDDEGPTSSTLEASKLLGDASRMMTAASASNQQQQQQPRAQQQQQQMSAVNSGPLGGRPQTQQQSTMPAASNASPAGSSATGASIPTGQFNHNQPGNSAAAAAQQMALSKRIAELIKRQGGSLSSQPAFAQLLGHLPPQQQQQLQQLLQQQQRSFVPGNQSTQQTSAAAGRTMSAAAVQQQQQQRAMGMTLGQQASQQQQQQQQSTGVCPLMGTFGWCKFGDSCQFVHTTTNREPLRHLPGNMTAQLQQQLAPQVLSGQITTCAELMRAIANTGAAKQLQQQQGGQAQRTAQQQPTASGSASSLSSSSTTAQQDLIAAQITHQQEAASMGAAKAKSIPCKFDSSGQCAYGSRCAYKHADKEAKAGQVGSSSTYSRDQQDEQPTAAAILAAMTREQSNNNNINQGSSQGRTSLLTVIQQQRQEQRSEQTESKHASEAAVAEGGSLTAGGGISSAKNGEAVSTEAVTSAWLKDHLSGTAWAEKLDITKSNNKPQSGVAGSAKEGPSSSGSSGSAAAAPPSSPPPAGSPAGESEDVESETEVEMTVDFGKVVDDSSKNIGKDCSGNNGDESGGGSSGDDSGPPPGTSDAVFVYDFH